MHLIRFGMLSRWWTKIDGHEIYVDKNNFFKFVRSTYHLGFYQRQQTFAPNCQGVQCRYDPYHCETVHDKSM